MKKLDIQEGDLWNTRDGGVARIERVYDCKELEYPVIASMPKYTRQQVLNLKGRKLTYKETDDDLTSLCFRDTPESKAAYYDSKRHQGTVPATTG